MNVYQKLLKARQMFIEKGVKKSGRNMSLEYKYFELEDIVPVATEIFAEIGLVPIVNFTETNAFMHLYDTEGDNNSIAFAAPLKVCDTNRGTTEIQAMGATITYYRRYLYMIALDICEPDAVDGNTPTKKTAQKNTPPSNNTPATPTERKEIQKKVTGANDSADELQVKALKAALKKLKDLDENQEEFIQQIVIKTEGFKKLKKTACEELILKVKEMINEYEH